MRNWFVSLSGSHPQVRRDARRLPVVLVSRFAMVTASAAAVGAVIARLT